MWGGGLQIFFSQEVISTTIDLEEIRTYRNRLRSRSDLAASSPSYPRIVVDFSLSPEHDTVLPTSIPIDWKYLRPEEEIAQVIRLKYLLLVLLLLF